MCPVLTAGKKKDGNLERMYIFDLSNGALEDRISWTLNDGQNRVIDVHYFKAKLDFCGCFSSLE